MMGTSDQLSGKSFWQARLLINQYIPLDDVKINLHYTPHCGIRYMNEQAHKIDKNHIPVNNFPVCAQ